VLLGENNAGKSNLVRALDIVLGDTWPTSFHPEDHDFYERDRDCLPMEVILDVSGINRYRYESATPIKQFRWCFDPAADADRHCVFEAVLHNDQRYWARTEERTQLCSVIVGADRRLSYELSYTSKWTMLSKLMRKFHERLVADPGRVDRLKERFSDVVEIFREVEEFTTFSDELRNMAATFAANLQYGLDLDFSAYDPSNYFRSLRVNPTLREDVRSFDELGTGQEQILAVAFAYAYARAYGSGDDGLVMVIEEPEAHLHPIAQRWLAKKVAGLHGDAVQVIVTTHSPAFVDLANPGGIALIRKPGQAGATMVVQHGRPGLAAEMSKTGAPATATSVGAFYSASATAEHVEGLFARACLVVEGPTEVLALPELLLGAGLDVLECGIAVVSAGGIGGIARWLRLYRAYGLPCYVTFDRDTKDDKEGVKRADLLRVLGEDVGSYEMALEGAGSLVVTSDYAVAVADFEESLRSLFPNYSDFEAQAKMAGAVSKPLVAREACKALRRDLDASGWASIRELADAISTILPASRSVAA
jgi:putative ATP-dependent endonuclease of OLD family